MTGGINGPRELVDLQDPRIGVRHAGRRLVERDMSVNADAAETDFDSTGSFDHLGKLRQNLGPRENNLLGRHPKFRTDPVEKQRTDLTAETQRMCHRNEFIPVVLHILVHEEEADIFQRDALVIDLFRHDPVGLCGTDRHDEVDNLLTRRRFPELRNHLPGQELIQLLQGIQHLQLTFGLRNQLLHRERKQMTHFLFSVHFPNSFSVFLRHGTPRLLLDNIGDIFPKTMLFLME